MSTSSNKVHLYTGPSKGKTTAALGLGMRAAGHGLRVYMIQFMKGQTNYGELNSIAKLDNFQLRQFGRPDFVDRDNPDPRDIEGAREGFEFAQQIVTSNEHDLVILDEIVCAVDFGLLDLSVVLELIKERLANVELVLTGRGASQKLIDACDYVTEMREIKHPYKLGIQARKGIEF